MGGVNSYGDVSGYGYVSGYGDGNGYDTITLSIPQDQPWQAYHYIRRSENGMTLRSGATVKVGDVLRENRIVLCECGLHASLTAEDAKKYRPPNSVLTRVLVWGRIIVDKDKLVATHRKIVEVLGDTP